MRRWLWLGTMVATVAVAGGCAPRKAAGDQALDPGSVFTADVPLVVESRFYGDLVIFVNRGGLRTRLGMANGNGKRTFMVPKQNFEIGTPIAFEAEGLSALTGGRVSVRSPAVVVRPGQRLVWTLETSLDRSFLAVQ